MKKREFKDAAYEQLARIGKAVASPKRIELLDLISQGEHSVESLANETGISIANASQHLQVLRAAQLVETRRDGQHIYYRATDPDIGGFVRSLRLLASKQLAELDKLVFQFNSDQGELESIDIQTLARRLRAGKVLLLDARPESEYLAGHLPGAINVPPEALARGIKALPKSKQVVAYCRGPYCVYAAEAVRLLRKQGFNAVRMHDGPADWRANGFLLETGK